MKGLELSETYYQVYGKEMLESQFPEILPYLAVGLAGSGSECFGFDDDISKDHDFEPGFCIFIPGEDVIDSRTAFRLERAYAKLPKEFMGFRRSKLSPVGGNRHGVILISDFFKPKTGRTNGNLKMQDWFSVPEQSLFEATNGKLFFDHLGKMTSIREQLSYLPEDVRLKKLAGELLVMGQAGQYNYPRCVHRKDAAAAQLAAYEFVKRAMHVIFLLNRSYLPYYKWEFHALKKLPMLSQLAKPLEYLISCGNNENTIRKKTELIEHICNAIVAELKKQELTKYKGAELEGHAYSVNDAVKDNYVRNLHVMYGVD